MEVSNDDSDGEKRNDGSLQTYKRCKDQDSMTKGELLTRVLLERELKKNKIKDISEWDPLISALGTEERKLLVKDIDSKEDIIPLPGVLAAPFRRRGDDLSLRDSSLFQTLNDVETLVRGSSQCMALTLDGKGEVAASQMARLLLLGSHVMSRLNTERLRLRYPKQLVAKALGSSTESVMRKAHRKKLKEAAQEARDTGVISRSFFHSGGRGNKRGQFRSLSGRLPRSRSASFPRTMFNRKSQQGWSGPKNSQQRSQRQFPSTNSKQNQ
jgi:hypothetical protein